jgi:hypothetical protein
MTRKMLGTLFGVVLAFALMVVPGMRADDEDQATQFTFNQPVEVPGNIVLPAGSYWFTVMTGTDGHAVQIFNADRTQLMARLWTIDKERPSGTNNSQVTVAEMSKAQPVALVNWFYPDRLTGHEFVYAEQMERRLAESNQITVTAQPAI